MNAPHESPAPVSDPAGAMADGGAERAASPPPVTGNVRWILLGNTAYAAGQWLQLVVLARWGGAAAVGAYAYALALSMPVMNFAGLQLGMLLVSDARGDYAFHEYRRLRLVTTAAAVLAIALVGAATGGGRDLWPILAPVCLMRAADALSEIHYAAWQRVERMSVIGWGLMLNSAASVTFMAAALMLGGGVPGAACGSALGSCAALALVHLRTAAHPEVRHGGARGAGFAWRRLGRLAVVAAPLGIILLLGSLQANVPLYFVRHYGGEVALGLFAAASQLTAAGGIVIGALGGAVTPRLAAARAAGDARSFMSWTRKLVVTGALLGVAGVVLSLLVGREVLVLMYRPEFGAGARVLVVLSAAAAAGFAARLLGYALTAARIITVQPLVLSTTLVVLVASCVALVPRHGAIGAALALGVASTIQALSSALVLRRSRLGDREPVRTIAGA